jgi:hypothetical protein
MKALQEHFPVRSVAQVWNASLTLRKGVKVLSTANARRPVPTLKQEFVNLPTSQKHCMFLYSLVVSLSFLSLSRIIAICRLERGLLADTSQRS